MKTKLVLFIAFLAPFYVFSQNTTDYITYLDSSYSKVSEKDYVFKKIVREYIYEKEEYVVEYYYRSGQLKQTGTTKSRDFDKYEGFLISFYENGNMYKKVFYQDGFPISIYRSWYENGKKRDEGLYIASNSKKTEDRILRINHYWDENEVQKVVNGEGTYLEQSGNSSLEGTVTKGFKDGIWKGKNNDYDFTFEEEYKNGEFISGVSTDKNLIKHTYKEILQKPAPKKGMEHFYNFVSNKFNIRGEYKGRAKILLSFIVEKNGAIGKVEVLKGVNSTLDKEAVRLLKSYSDWQPGKSRGIKVNVSHTLPIVFDLE